MNENFFIYERRRCLIPMPIYFSYGVIQLTNEKGKIISQNGGLEANGDICMSFITCR